MNPYPFIPGLELSRAFYEEACGRFSMRAFPACRTQPPGSARGRTCQASTRPNARIEDEAARRLPPYLGGVDQWVDSTDVLSYADRYLRLKILYARSDAEGGPDVGPEQIDQNEDGNDEAQADA